MFLKCRIHFESSVHENKVFCLYKNLHILTNSVGKWKAVKKDFWEMNLWMEYSETCWAKKIL